MFPGQSPAATVDNMEQRYLIDHLQPQDMMNASLEAPQANEFPAELSGVEVVPLEAYDNLKEDHARLSTENELKEERLK